ncbi:ParB-like nuclease domain-containing protein [Mesorhizobium caraganae]|uniref:ParB N-terminal domain-containing protein n=1 Tax=Mesorhizobium caraganae TaxID=483206 RepID=UPI0019399AE4|nr:ParB N-terminal domain-containing protein [Mesorhizobium caraganae]MBM2715851.1 ParB-like nuclease domain-containing protein [Mesorhizobium caraganae]
MRFDGDDIEDMDTAEALEAIRQVFAEHPEGPQGDPDVLDLEELRTLECVFQPRDLSFREGDHEAHVDTLKKAIGKPEKPQYLDAITVWWGGDRWYILDGHHRRLAYERAKVKKGIPVRAFTGTVEEALAQSVSLNSKDKLAMSLRDKMNTAWRLTAYTDYSKSKIAAECGVGERSVANMRSIRRALIDLGKSAEKMAGMAWAEAQLEARGEQKLEIDQDAATEKRAKGYAKSIARALKDRPHKDPEGFARALQMLDERLPMRLLETNAWADALSDFRKVLEAEEEFGDY